MADLNSFPNSDAFLFDRATASGTRAGSSVSRRREFGITFSAAMVTAILHGRKTETRRLAADAGPLARTAPGDLLWIREAFHVHEWDTHGRRARISYVADAEQSIVDIPWPERLVMGKTGKKLPRFMPREASRTLLVLDERRREPLLEISDSDALAEGIDLSNPLPHEIDDAGGWKRGALAGRYLDLWDHLNAARGHGRVTKPDVDVFRFRLQPH